MHRTHVIYYTALTATGVRTGLAQVPSSHHRPTWPECAAQVPGYFRSEYVGPADAPPADRRTARLRLLLALLNRTRNDQP